MKKDKKVWWTHLHTVTNNTVSETTIIRIVAINMCKIIATVKLHVEHGLKMASAFFSTENSENSTYTSYTTE